MLKQWHLEDLPEVLQAAQEGRITLLDARTPREYEAGHIDGFLNIPLDGLRGRLLELDPAKPVYALCQSGLRSYTACRILEGSGFTAYNLAGGYRLYAEWVKRMDK